MGWGGGGGLQGGHIIVCGVEIECLQLARDGYRLSNFVHFIHIVHLYGGLPHPLSPILFS